MRYGLFGRRALLILTVACVLAACSAPNPGDVAQYAAPSSVQQAKNVQVHTLGRSASSEAAVYVSFPEDYSGPVIEALKPGKKKLVAECTISESGTAYPLGLTTDSQGNLYAANSRADTVTVYAPGCQYTATISDPNPAPIDVAVNGSTVYIASQYGPTRYESLASIAVCSVTSGCTSELTNSDMYGINAITLDKNGNLYVSGGGAPGDGLGHILFEFPHGQMPGTVLGTDEPIGGGLQFDKHGNLISTYEDSNPNSLTVLSGCPSACQVHGPFPLAGAGDDEFLTLNRSNTTLDITDDGYLSGTSYSAQTIDVYSYRGTAGVTYKRSIAVPAELRSPAGIAVFPAPEL
jgi:hypothetical protein